MEADPLIAELPIDALSKNYQVATTLDGVTLIFLVRWNGRAASWFFDLLDVNGDPIISGVRIVLGQGLGRLSKDPRYPNGLIIASDLSGAGIDPGIDDLGTRVKLYYYPAADLT